MSIPFTGTGGLYTRLGRLGALLNALNDFRGTVTLGPKIDDIAAQYQSAAQDLADQLYSQRDSYRAVHGGLTAYLRDRGIATVIRMADDDVKLVSVDLPTAMAEVIAQMKDGSHSVQASVPAVSVTAAPGNTADASVIASVKGPDGKDLQYLFAETLELTVTGDSHSGTGAAAREPLTLRGEVPQADPLSWDWPKGSGAATPLTFVDANTDASDNLLTNSDYERFTTANTPDNWAIDVGGAGTTVFSAGSSDAFGNQNALKITGNGSELTTLTQKFNDSTGTLGRLLPSTVYAVNLWLKVSSVPASGAIEFALVDGSGTIVQDANGTPNSFTVSLPDQTTSYAAASGFFRTPIVLPSVLKFRVKLTTALESGKSVFIDRLAFAPAVQAYPGGPFVGAFSGKVNAVVNDKWNLAVTMTYGGFQKLFERFFGMRSLGLTLPFSDAPTISDSLLA